MSLKGSNSKAPGKKAPLLEAGTYPARVAQVIDLGLQPQNPWQGKEKPPVQMIMVTYELVSEFLLDEDGNPDPEKPRWLSERFPLYGLGADKAKSTLRYLAIDPGKKFDGDWTELVGGACLVTVVHNQSKGVTYANIGSLSPAMKGMEVPPLVNQTKVFVIDEPDMEVFENIPEWIQDLIKGNLNYQGSELQRLLGEQPKAQPDEEQEYEEPAGKYDNLDDAAVPF